MFFCCAGSWLWCAGLSCSRAWGILVPCCSVAQLCLILCGPIDCSTPGFPTLHHLPEFAQTHVHWVSDAIQPSHPLSSPSPPAFSLFQHQSLFQWVGPGIEPTFPELEGEFLVTGPSGKSQGLHKHASLGCHLKDWLQAIILVSAFAHRTLSRTLSINDCFHFVD